MQTQAVEDYLKAIYELQSVEGKVATTTLAEHLNVAPASVTGMVKKLASMHLVAHEPYQGVSLTDAGLKIALEVIRHHRLIELYLAEALRVPWDQVHEEADKWEHVLSEEMEDRIDAMLGHPTTDPHGAPIPTRSGVIVRPSGERLADMEPGQKATIAEVSDHDPALLRYLGGLGLYPQIELSVVDSAPFDGPITVRIGKTEHALGREVAGYIYVTDVQPES
ncbi:MAG: metal-dependent transcriptional regulator [Chloroflexi bacterium]|nr:metal-dependent transcriptional regulator [Chloroflexota bacterium]